MQRIEERENMNELQTDLSKCSYEGTTIFLPKIDEETLENYDQVRQALLKAGAKYKHNTFVFPNEAKPYIDRLMGGESVNIQKEFQFFATPQLLAEKMVMLADIQPHHRILEPSAGQGAIIEAIHRYQDLNQQELSIVDYYELMDINRDILEKKFGNPVRALLVGHDFMGEPVEIAMYDRVIANPPFTKGQDMDHINLMYRYCKPGGKIISLCSNSWQFAGSKKHQAFKIWLEAIEADIEQIPEGAFKESGTNIATCLIIINK